MIHNEFRDNDGRLGKPRASGDDPWTYRLEVTEAT